MRAHNSLLILISLNSDKQIAGEFFLLKGVFSPFWNFRLQNSHFRKKGYDNFVTNFCLCLTGNAGFLLWFVARWRTGRHLGKGSRRPPLVTSFLNAKEIAREIVWLAYVFVHFFTELEFIFWTNWLERYQSQFAHLPKMPFTPRFRSSRLNSNQS